MLIILDRDGVINQYHGQYICSVDEWIPLPGSIEAIGRLCQAGHRIAIATNQSGLARGYYDESTLKAMHRRLAGLVGAVGGNIAHIAYCPHHPDDGCDCRKPRTGLLEQIQVALGLPSLKGSLMIGDSRKDLLAGRKAGIATYLVRTGNGLATERNLGRRPLPGVEVFDDLQAVTDYLLGTVAA